MKKFLFPAIASVALAAGAFGYYANNQTTALDALTLQNIEALSFQEPDDGYSQVNKVTVQLPNGGTSISINCTGRGTLRCA